MNAERVSQLSAWLAATDIDLLELRGEGTELRLLREGGRVDVMAPGEGIATAQPVLPVAAPSVGIFLHSHPLHDAPLAVPGQAVAAGEALGLLRIGALLLPVIAPQAGTVAGHLVAHGTVVGYGTPVVDLITTPMA